MIVQNNITWYLKRLFIALTVVILMGSSPALTGGPGGDSGICEIFIEDDLRPHPLSDPRFLLANGEAEFCRDVQGQREFFVVVRNFPPEEIGKSFDVKIIDDDTGNIHFVRPLIKINANRAGEIEIKGDITFPELTGGEPDAGDMVVVGPLRGVLEPR